MRETSLKLSFLVVVLLVAFSSFLLPFTAEARHKHLRNKNCHHHRRRPPVSPPQPPIPAPTPPPNAGVPPYQIHGCGYPCSDSNDCDWPCTICCANQTCCYDEPFFPPTPTLAPSPSIEAPTSPPSPSPAPILLPLAPSPSVDEAPASAPNDGVAVPRYPIPGGCGWRCSDSNDCNWPCTECCPDHTCCYEQAWPPMF